MMIDLKITMKNKIIQDQTKEIILEYYNRKIL